jgi:hypothetical protein
VGEDTVLFSGVQNSTVQQHSKTQRRTVQCSAVRYDTAHKITVDKRTSYLAYTVSHALSMIIRPVAEKDSPPIGTSIPMVVWSPGVRGARMGCCRYGVCTR